MGRYEAVLFDFDGVLVDSEPIHYQCWTEILKPFGLTLDWETYCRRCIGVSDRAMLERLCEECGPPLDLDTLWAEYPRKKEMFRERMLREDPFLPEVRELLGSLRNYKLAVVTSSGRREVEPILSAASLLPLFGTVIYGDDVRRLKPAPDPYKLGVERLGVNRALAVEDSEAGIQSARAAGLDVVEVREHAQMVQLVQAALF